MVQSVSQHTSITSIVQSCIYLPNGEEALVTHIGTMQISSTLTLTRVLCVPSFSFNLISISKLTKNLYCCLFFFFFFFRNCCFIQDLAQWSMIGLDKECKGLYLLFLYICRKILLLTLLLLSMMVTIFLQNYGTID